MKFLLLSPRVGEAVSASEYQDFLHASGLSQECLDQVILDTPDSEIPSLDPYAGIFVGGSPFTVTAPISDIQWQNSVSQKLVKLATTSPLPVFFTCYGASLLASALGGTVDTDSPEEVSATEIQLSTEALTDPITSGLKNTFFAMTAHTENVSSLPDDAVILGSGPHCPVQLYRLGISIWASQFHAEMTVDSMKKRMAFYSNNGYYNAEEMNSVYAGIDGTDTHDANMLLRNFVSYSLALQGENPK